MKRKLFVGLLALLVPAVAFLYLSRLRLASTYLFVGLLIVVYSYTVGNDTLATIIAPLVSLVAIVNAVIFAKTQDETKKPYFFNKWWGALSIVGVLYLSIFFFRAFIFEPFVVPSNSMSPNINGGNYVLVKKLGYGTYGSFGLNLANFEKPRIKPNAGEVFALNSPFSDVIYLKRIIGVPGDEIVLSGSKLYINDQLVSKPVEPPIFVENLGLQQYQISYAGKPNRYSQFTISVPDGYYFVLGDNRNNSIDSREWGLISQGDLIGKVVHIW